MRDGELMSTGKVPSQVSIEDAQDAARKCVLNSLAVLKAELGGSLERLARLVRIGAFVQSDDGFFRSASSRQRRQRTAFGGSR